MSKRTKKPAPEPDVLPIHETLPEEPPADYQDVDRHTQESERFRKAHLPEWPKTTPDGVIVHWGPAGPPKE